MYDDRSPVPNCPARRVIVVEEKDKPYTALFVDEVIKKARIFGATSRDVDNDEIFWIVYAHEPRRLWDMTESALRSSLREPKAKLTQKEASQVLSSLRPTSGTDPDFDYEKGELKK